MQSRFLFVYGTLKSDASNPNALFLHQHAQFIGKAKWQGSLYLVSNYPGAVPSMEKGEYVYGELWELNHPESLLIALDEYEECSPHSPVPHEYTRSLGQVQLDPYDKLVKAWIYIYKLDTARLSKIAGGSFVNTNQELIRRIS